MHKRPSPALLALALLAAVSGFASAPADSSAQKSAVKAAVPSDLWATFKFRNLGPAVAGGRVSAVTGVPGQPGVYYIGAAAGGVFKTTDGGNRWKAVFEHEASASIGAIAVAPSNSNLIWVGTGEPNPRNDVVDGAGVYFSPDAGASWKPMGLEQAGQIGRILINPSNPDEVWVAALGNLWAPTAERGVFHSSDGGAHWTKTLFVNDLTGVVDLAMEPGNPKVLLAAAWQVRRYPWNLEDGGPGSGIYRSTDGGVSWTKLGDGLPGGPLGRIGLATAASDPQRVYALMEAKKGVLWRSDDLGTHWTQVSDNRALDVRSFYFTRLAVDPANADHVYFLAFRLQESTDGGKTVHVIGKDVHPDHHALWIDPRDPKHLLEGNDGGVYVSRDGGQHWRFLNNLPIGQMYSVALDSRQPFHLCAGLQDNSAWCGASSSLSASGVTGRDWAPVMGGDGEYSVPAPSDPDIVYSDMENGVIQRTDLRTHASTTAMASFSNIFFVGPRDMKYRFNWTAPIAVSFTNANDLYLGGNVVFHSTDGGAHWQVVSPDLTRNDLSKLGPWGGPVHQDYSGAETIGAILSLAFSPLDPHIIWAGTDDGLVQVTRDGGQHWQNVTANLHGVDPWGMVRQIDASPFDAATAYVALDRHAMNDRKPYVFRTNDYGQNWQAITGGLPPNDPVHVVREDPNHRGLLVAGTDTGLFASTDDGRHWTALKSNFPTVPVFDLKFDRASHSLVVATHGRGAWVLDNLTPLEDTTPAVRAAAFFLFPSLPATAYVRWDTGAGGDGVTYSAPNAPAGAMIDYWLKQELKVSPEQKKRHETPVRIEIRDGNGQLIKTQFGKSKQGYNRAVWDLNFQGARTLNFGTAKAASAPVFSDDGPAVLPGRYQIAVTVNGQLRTQWVEVRQDPKLPLRPTEARAWLQLALANRDDRSTLNAALNQLNSIQKQLDAIQANLEANGAGEKDPVIVAARDLAKKAKQLEDGVFQPDVQRGAEEDELQHPPDLFRRMEYFAFMASTDNRNQPVNQSAIEEQQATHGLLQTWLARYRNFLKTEIGGFNQEATRRGTPMVATTPRP